MRNLHLDHVNRARPNTITPDEQKLIHQHRVDEAEFQKKLADHNLAVALRLGAALKVLKGEA